ncbi:epoxide hydrolase 1 [Biomphalaria pfeifferi]|uniref:Epoxide hydrolase 1 n=1 Tax=Biomphalaria pfeifferi TaxID=112525 RepID=A0AAD8EZR0_BIOPF|nr:epoxide hydrolase 1 [Biomphalaria pfeifferi]
MSEFIKQIFLRVIGAVYSIWVLLKILKECFTVGFSEVFAKKPIARPACLDDTRLGSHGFLTLTEIKIHYVASGPEDKPLMLFIHGFPDFWFSWRYQITEVVAYDQRGYGESEKPKHVRDNRVNKLTSDCRQIVEALGYQSCVLVGHDWGALVAWECCRLFPKMVDRLIVISGPPPLIFKQIFENDREQQKLSWYCLFFLLPYLPELYLRMKNYEALESCFGIKKTGGLCFSGPLHKPMKTEELNAYKYVFSQSGALTSALNYYRAILSEVIPVPPDYKYTVPSLLLWGCSDKCLTNTAPDLVEKQIDNVTVKRFKDAGHFVQMDQPDEVNQTIRKWLKELK